MKILCVIDSLGSGGAQRQLVELALGFKERGNTVSFLTYHKITFFYPVLNKAEISITCIRANNYLKRFLQMRSFIRRGKFDAILSFLEAPNLICELAGFPFRKWRLVVGERNADPNIVKKPKLIIYRWFHFFADYVVANSYSNLKFVRAANPLLSDVKCIVIYNAIDINHWKPLESFISRKNEKLNLIIAASHSYRKNLKGLINSLALLDKNDLSKISIEWYGDSIHPPYYDSSIVEGYKMIKAYKLESVIKFHPATQDILSKIQNADAIGLFSFNEGMPNVICEAMACGKPVICSAVSDVPDILSQDNHLLFDPYESKSIAMSLHYLISMKDKELSLNGKANEKIAHRKFNREIIISTYLKLLSK